MHERNHTFVTAIAFLRRGKHRITRATWGHSDFVAPMPPLELASYTAQQQGQKVNDRTAEWIGKDTPLNVAPYFAYYNAQANIWTPGYYFTPEDIMADDWRILGTDPLDDLPEVTFALTETDRDFDIRSQDQVIVYDIAITSKLTGVLRVNPADMPTGPGADDRLRALAREQFHNDVELFRLDSASFGPLLNEVTYQRIDFQPEE